MTELENVITVGNDFDKRLNIAYQKLGLRPALPDTILPNELQKEGDFTIESTGEGTIIRQTKNLEEKKGYPITYFTFNNQRFGLIGAHNLAKGEKINLNVSPRIDISGNQLTYADRLQWRTEVTKLGLASKRANKANKAVK